MSLAENTLLTAHGLRLVRAGFVRERALAAFTAATIGAVRRQGRPGPDAAAQSLSGGNLQKFIVGREIRQRPERLHRGAADVGTRRRGGGRRSARR